MLSLNTSTFCDFSVDRIYLIKLETKESTDTAKSTSCLNIQLEIDSEGKLRTKLYDKRDYLNFFIVNFPFMCSTCIWSIYLSVDSDIPELVVSIKISLIEIVAYKETTTTRVPIG